MVLMEIQGMTVTTAPKTTTMTATLQAKTSPPIMSAYEALNLVQSGQRVYIGGGCGVPKPLLSALVEHAPELRNVEVVHMLTAGETPVVAPEFSESFRHNALFIGSNTRRAVNEGRADFTPIFLSE